MATFIDPIITDNNNNGEAEAEEEDAFLGFIDYAISILTSDEKNDSDRDVESSNNYAGPSWNWIVSRILKTCSAYSSGVTSAILLSDLSQAWNEQYQFGFSKRKPELITQMQKKHRRTRLPNAVTIDSIYEKNFLSTSSILEAVVLDVFVLPGTNIYMISLGDFWSSNTIDLYLHRRYYDLVDPESPDNGILKKGREIFLTGCCLRTAAEGSGCRRLLPTEYLVILLDENKDEDAMLLGAQFCSDTFSSISHDAVNNSGAAYSFYARIESIGLIETRGRFGSIQPKQITLVDNEGVNIKFILWGEQVLLVNLLSVGGMLALDRPFVASPEESNIEISEELFLEYGTATQLYLVPFIPREEQICIASTQNRSQGSRALNATSHTQGPKVSQVMLPCNSEGTIDFSNYPFRTFVIDLHDKMTSVSLYGIVTNMFREIKTGETVFVLQIEDKTGAITAKLHFVTSWSLGRLNLGHTIYISGLTCYMTPQKLIEVSWFEKDVGASLVNLSCSPSLLNSSCLHKLSCLSDPSGLTNITRICVVRLAQVEHFYVNSRFSHSLCGHFVNEMPDGYLQCNFCRCACDDEVVRTFHLKIPLVDDSTKILAWCTGPAAAELLQISPDEFYELSEDEQAMYLYTLVNEKFIVTIVNCSRQEENYGDMDNLDNSNRENETVIWEIAHALKCE
ncbi:hypothetical protein MKW98_004764 [Papaver atlanticum]|uniref:Nucleic acid-binding protein n=1 Tax=Papaver atlanticum TaxID=357466 RepID=A0AAD4XIP3_9MAGN|nr:hypothetical protein MKW98_004764 [Papaver atlanticum]